MSVAGFLEAAVSPVKAIADLIDDVVETPEEKRAAETVKARLAQNSDRAQTAVNAVEARHRSIFVAGWRPAVGWICAIAFGWHFVGADLARWSLALAGDTTELPVLTGVDHLVTVLMGMLGLGGLRTIEKLQGRAK